MSSAEMTPAMRRGLLWFADQYGAVRYFDRSAPRTATRLKLLQAGLIRLFYCQRSGKPCFAVTPSGEIAARALNKSVTAASLPSPWAKHSPPKGWGCSDVA